MLNGVSLLVNSCFKDRIGRDFYIALWSSTKNGSTMIIQSAENHGECPDMSLRRRSNRIFMVPRLCSAFDGISSVWCIMSCWKDRYRTQLMRLSRALKNKWPPYHEGHDKVILQHDNARPHFASPVKTYLETLEWEVLPHPQYSPNVALSDYHFYQSMA